MENRVTEILGSEYPIIQGAMRLITMGEMAAAVSRSGGFGVIASSGLEGERLRAEIRKAQSLTNKPFGINIPIYRPNAFEALEIAIEEGVKTITTSAGDPVKLIKRVKEAGLRMLQVIATVEMAKKAEAGGADAVIAIGAEGGGHVGRDEISTMVLIPQVVDAVKIPVVAAGGIGDGRGWVSTFALGAEGIQMGTRFLATKECPISETHKQAILEAKDNSTMIAARKGYPIRVLKNKAAMTIRTMDESGAGQDEINTYVDKISREGGDDRDNKLMSAGQVAGLIQRIMTVEELILDMVAEARRVAQNLGKTF
ncbi:MAG: nitronate monooxygenase [Deltaproteobacteria bacterium]|nr:nitronate monooxygenase [Deltaproteobacteria bacterium]MDO9210135.1 nitronate monooxygenase [Deltaproteobacteria bacterium]